MIIVGLKYSVYSILHRTFWAIVPPHQLPIALPAPTPISSLQTSAFNHCRLKNVNFKCQIQQRTETSEFSCRYYGKQRSIISCMHSIYMCTTGFICIFLITLGKIHLTSFYEIEKFMAISPRLVAYRLRCLWLIENHIYTYYYMVCGRPKT